MILFGIHHSDYEESFTERKLYRTREEARAHLKAICKKILTEDEGYLDQDYVYVTIQEFTLDTPEESL